MKEIRSGDELAPSRSGHGAWLTEKTEYGDEAEVELPDEPALVLGRESEIVGGSLSHALQIKLMVMRGSRKLIWMQVVPRR